MIGRGTTPTLIIEFDPEEFKVSEIARSTVAFSQWNAKLVLDWPVPLGQKGQFEFDDDRNAIVITLTQAQTLMFQEGEVNCQVRGLFDDGTAWDSEIWIEDWGKTLDERVLTI